MKQVLLVVVLAAAVFCSAGMSAQGAKFVPVTGLAYMVAPPEGGDLKCIGGTPNAAGAWPPCSPGSRTQLRNVRLSYYQVVYTQGGQIDPLHTGLRTALFNANLEPDGSGTAWAKWQVVLDSGTGKWEGTVNGKVEGWGGAFEADVVGRGVSGDVQGMQLRFLLTCEQFPGAVEQIVGYRFEPGK